MITIYERASPPQAKGFMLVTFRITLMHIWQKQLQMNYENENKVVKAAIHFLLVKINGDYVVFFRGCSIISVGAPGLASMPLKLF